MPTLHDVSRDELGALLEDEPSYRIDQIWAGLYERAADVSDLPNVPKALRERLADELPPALEVASESKADAGTTTKWLWRLRDRLHIETVLMKYPERATVCVSTQAGCAMACGFCATGQAGFDRHLTSGEIVEQVLRASRSVTPTRVSNVVFMGMGEPLANYDAVWAAVERLHGDVGLSARHLTISTVGIIPGIERLGREDLPVNLAVSLHAANDRLRDELVPVNRRYPIADLMAACRTYLDRKRRRVSFEWALIEGVNDRPRDAAELSTLARHLGAHVNLIPLNPTPGYPTRGTDRAGVADFAEALTDAGINATVRHNRGTDIDAACGQLRATRTAAVGSERSDKRWG